MLEIEEFYELVKLSPQVKTNIERYKHEDTGISSSLLKLDLSILDLDTIFLPSPPMEEPIPITRDKELLDNQPKFPSSPLSTLPDVPPLVTLKFSLCVCVNLLKTKSHGGFGKNILL